MRRVNELLLVEEFLKKLYANVLKKAVCTPLKENEMTFY